MTTAKPVYMYNSKGELVKEFKTTEECGDYFGKDPEYINYNLCHFDKIRYKNEWYRIRRTKEDLSSKANPIYMYDMWGDLIETFYSIKECAEYCDRDENSVRYNLDFCDKIRVDGIWYRLRRKENML